MSDSHQDPVVEPSQHVSAGHAPIDIGLRVPLIFLAVVAVACISACVIVFGLASYYKSEEKALGRSAPAMFKNADGQFPEPRLQRNPPEDMSAFLARERATLSSYGWVDKKSGIARIPIDRALELIAERGLPAIASKLEPNEAIKKP